MVAVLALPVFQAPGPDGGAIAIDVIGIIYNLNFYI